MKFDRKQPIEFLITENIVLKNQTSVSLRRYFTVYRNTPLLKQNTPLLKYLVFSGDLSPGSKAKCL